MDLNIPSTLLGHLRTGEREGGRGGKLNSLYSRERERELTFFKRERERERLYSRDKIILYYTRIKI